MPKKTRKHSLSVKFHKLVVVFYSYADSVAVQRNQVFCYLSDSSTQKCCLLAMLQRKTVFVVFQSEATKNKSHGFLIRHFTETIVMKIAMHFRTNVNYMAYKSDCLIEICYTHSITFDYQTHFSLTIYLQVTFSKKCL